MYELSAIKYIPLQLYSTNICHACFYYLVLNVVLINTKIFFISIQIESCLAYPLQPTKHNTDFSEGK